MPREGHQDRFVDGAAALVVVDRAILEEEEEGKPQSAAVSEEL